MTEKRYYQRDFEELYYIIDSNVISEKEFDEKVDYDGYSAFEDSLTGEEIVDLLNENEQRNQQHRQLQIEFNDACGIVHDLRESKLDLEDENEQLKQTNERIVKDIDLALGFIRHKGYSLQDIKDYEDAKKEYEEDLAYYRKGDVE